MSVSIVMAYIPARVVLKKYLKKLGSHCSNAVACTGSTSKRFTTRIVYNSNFVNTTLFGNLHIKKLKPLCNNVKENVLFLDVVKRNIAPRCRNTFVPEISTSLCQN